MKRIILFILIFTFFFSCSIDESLEDLLVQAIDYRGFSDEKWTIMFYMCADNNLNLASVDDINEMISINVPIWCPDENINIVVLWDQSDIYPGGDRHGYYLVKYSGIKLLKDTGELLMGEVQTVNDFLDFTIDKYKADNYVFVFWDHGSGVDKSVISAETNIQKSIGLDLDPVSSGDGLSDSEQVQVLQHLYNKAGKKAELVIYDACLMGMAELMYQAMPYVKFFIGSEDNVPGAGLDYSFLSEVFNDPGITTRTLAKKAVSFYAAKYSSSTQVTMTAVDLSKMENLALNIYKFANEARNGGDEHKSHFYYSNIYTEVNFYPFSNLTGSGYDFADLYYYIKKVRDNLIDDGHTGHLAIPPANNIINLFDGGGIIVSEYHGASHTGITKGISILLGNTESSYSGNAFNATTSWAGYLTWLGIP